MSPKELRRRFEKAHLGPAIDWRTQVFPRDYKRVDDPELAIEVACRTERNNIAARQLGLPEVGQSFRSAHGLEFVVQGHAYLPTANTLKRWNQGGKGHPEDLYPIIEPTNMSKRFMDFVSAVDRCTTKILMVVDTVPHIRTWEAPFHNSLDTAVVPDSMVLRLDAARAHETVFAHEIGHAWVQYVDRCEDERALKDDSDPARLHQLTFIQSYVLDLKVNDVLRRKGFDMSPIDGDLAKSMNSLGRALSVGYRPENPREALFMSLQVAAQIVERERGNALGLVRFDETLGKIRVLDAEIHKLGVGMAEAVFEFGLDTTEAVQRVVDACLKLGFGFTGDPLDLDNDLIVPPHEEPDFDKYPQWLSGAYPKVKCEIGRHMALQDIPVGSRTHLENRGDHAMLSFILPDESVRGPWRIPVPFAKWLMEHTTGEVMRMNQMAKERQKKMMEEVDRMNRESKARQEALMAQALGRPLPTVPSWQAETQQPHVPGIPSEPSVGPPFPGGIPGRRPYMAGLGRFLTEARLAERLGGEHPYAYAMDNPTTYVDPDGLRPLGLRQERAPHVEKRGDPFPFWPPKFCPGIRPFEVGTLPGCVFCLKNRVMPTLDTLVGGDKYLHCMAGCLAQNRCTWWCPPTVGYYKEVGDALFGGTVESDDIDATNDGWECGETIRGGWKGDVQKCHDCCKGNGWLP
ncbi:MAG: hypothetical protein QY327_06675 [Fimbriimonadaceae bacterium]|nr:MAG: hypothetical protein QY327_06675 [Fimbriimonadaceae bacterium]